MNRIPLWTKFVFGAGFFGGATVLIKEKLGGSQLDVSVDLKGKVAVVTGGNSGIGFEVAKDLASRGAKVYLACRDKERCGLAREDIYIETENKNVFCRYCDLAYLDSVKRFARRLQKDEEKIDLLINNAGLMWCPFDQTVDGLETQLSVNHMGHFLLTNLLIEQLKKGAPSRVVNVSSRAHYKGKINVQDLNSSKDYSASGAYNQSKLANVLFTKELARRLDGTGVTVNAVHPGIVDSNIIRNTSFVTKVLKFILYPIVWPFVKSPFQGAQSVLNVALNPDLETTTGEYFDVREIAEPSQEAKNDKLALWLWLTSEKWSRLDAARKELGVAPLPPKGLAASGNIPDLKSKDKSNRDKSASNEEVTGIAVPNVLPS